MFDIGSFFANLDIGWNDNLEDLDYDGNGVLDGNDCPFPSGSTESRLWWRNVMEPHARSSIEPEWTEQYGDRVVGGYKGKPLVPGVKGSATNPQGDFDFLKDKIKVTQGLSESSARKIAAKVMWAKF